MLFPAIIWFLVGFVLLTGISCRIAISPFTFGCINEFGVNGMGPYFDERLYVRGLELTDLCMSNNSVNNS